MAPFLGDGQVHDTRVSPTREGAPGERQDFPRRVRDLGPLWGVSSLHVTVRDNITLECSMGLIL